MSDDFDARYAEKVSQADKEARHRRAVAKTAEPLLQGLQPGVHLFSPVEFRALVHYIFESEPRKIARALQAGRFELLGIKFVADFAFAGETTTISAFARERGVPQRTLHDRAAKAGLVSKCEGARKLYAIVELNALLAEGRG